MENSEQISFIINYLNILYIDKIRFARVRTRLFHLLCEENFLNLAKGSNLKNTLFIHLIIHHTFFGDCSNVLACYFLFIYSVFTSFSSVNGHIISFGLLLCSLYEHVLDP